jgi:putative ABC transport system ATP-binding protein
MSILQATHVTKQYRMGELSVTALDRVEFKVEQGEFVAIMGPSGSGKSTLLHLLGGLDGTSDGEITLAGKALSKLNDNEVTMVRRRNVGFIFQFYNLVPTLSAEENISLPLLIDGRNMNEYQAKIDELLTLVGLTDRRDHKPDQLSGGQQQRVAIARAFVTDPDIVLADEPTGNLDSKSGKAILELLRHSCDELHHTIVMVTHDAYAASYADRVVFLKDGRTVRELHKLNGDQNQFMASIMDEMGKLEVMSEE